MELKRGCDALRRGIATANQLKRTRLVSPECFPTPVGRTTSLRHELKPSRGRLAGVGVSVGRLSTSYAQFRRTSQDRLDVPGFQHHQEMALAEAVLADVESEEFPYGRQVGRPKARWVFEVPDSFILKR